MLALEENRSYGLSGGCPLPRSRGANVSVFHVKLTDSAARAISTFHHDKVSSAPPTISFNGNQGKITIPCSENGGEARIFMFGVTNVAQDNPHGSFDCIQQLSTSAVQDLSCLGVIQKKMTVKATDDSYDKALQSMAQAEEETRSRGAIVIKHGGRFQGKKVTVRAPAPALASLTKPRCSAKSLFSGIKAAGASTGKTKGAGESNGKSSDEVQQRPIRERVTHLLALRPYKRPELMLRLLKDGLTARDKGMLDTVLKEVGHVNSRNNTLVLKDSVYKELQKDWPGYTSGDQQLLKRILVRRLFQPQQNLLTVPETQVSPLRDTPNSSPAHRPKHSLTEEYTYTDPLASKKTRISHLSRKTAISALGSSPQVAHSDVISMPRDDSEKHSLDPRTLLDSLSAACRQDADYAVRLRQTSCKQETSQPQAAPERPLKVPQVDKKTIKRKKSKHREQMEERRRGGKERKRDDSPRDVTNQVAVDCAEPADVMFDSDEPQSADDSTDYLTKYTEISSHPQRQLYKEEFNKEYSEYRDLHARIDSVTRQFMELDTQLKQLHHDSHKYKTIHNQILHDYRNIKKSNPNYSQDRIRCQYLHNKLAHIKKLISNFDQQQLQQHSAPN
ncbi:RNA polymerase II elongation factor ELL-like [Dunckerocampus dactyliophorus]|uniref:RNA polymerase II elongation factor ELL-like n=1 Tax=Dunckerocampus dactyliophorus TaxID=161453 RepID=UPI0024066D2F|nr:RNA polymerase II elongation factor ELL-like [Dunckerocampus dactyliophorus]